MIATIRAASKEYPGQFWLMFWGMLISTIGSSIVWPFLMIYASTRLQLPLPEVTILNSMKALVGLFSVFWAGSIADRVGRKWVMVISLAINGACYLFMSQATSFWQFAILMCVLGLANPLYRVGSDAMMADLVPPEKRLDAYSLLRMSNNVGVALGPAIGGFVASVSYNLAFICAATGLITYSLLLIVRAKETLPARSLTVKPAEIESARGYRRIFKDYPFLTFVGSFTMTYISAAIMWVLLSVYTKNYYGLPEKMYGFIPATNAIMVIAFQLLVTKYTKRFKPNRVMALGALFYAIGVGSVAFGRGFWGFWLSMVIMTIGELILVPTSSTYAANLAPADMRGRYMGIYSLTWGVAEGIGPFLSTNLSKVLGPQYIWLTGGAAALISVPAFLLLSLWQKKRASQDST